MKKIKENLSLPLNEWKEERNFYQVTEQKEVTNETEIRESTQDCVLKENEFDNEVEMHKEG